MVAAMELSSLYRTFQVYKFGNRKYNFLLKLFRSIECLTWVCVLQNTDKHTVKYWNEYSPVFCETVFGTVLVPGTGVQP